MYFNLVVEATMLKLKESNDVTQEPVFLKTFVETTVQTETAKTKKVAVQTET